MPRPRVLGTSGISRSLQFWTDCPHLADRILLCNAATWTVLARSSPNPGKQNEPFSVGRDVVRRSDLLLAGVA